MSLNSITQFVRRNAWLPVATAIASAFLVLLSWAASSPIGSSPDEDYHLSSIWCGQGFRDGLCEPASTDAKVTVPAALFEASSCFAFHDKKSANCDQSVALAETERSNANGGYPPVYYWATSFFASNDLESSVIAMRLFNAALFLAALVVSIVVLPRKIGRLPLLATIFTIIPLGLFIVPSVNPSSWAYTSILLFFPAAVAFLGATTVRDRWWFGVVSAVALLMGAGSRADAAVYAVIALAVSWILLGIKRTLSRTNIIYSVVVGVLSFGLYKLAGQADYWNNGSTGGIDFGHLVWNVANLPSLWAGVFGTWGLGWLDTKMTPNVWVYSLTVFVAVVFMRLSGLSLRKGIAVGIVAATLVALPLYMLTIHHNIVGSEVQPRYLMPLLTLLVVVALWSERDNDEFALSPLQWAFIGFGILGANATALHINIRRYVTGIDVTSVNLDAKAEWWWTNFPLSPNGVWILGSLSMAVLLVSLYAMRDRLGLVAAKTETANH